jgi:hypothetical protein
MFNMNRAIAEGGNNGSETPDRGCVCGSHVQHDGNERCRTIKTRLGTDLDLADAVG